MIVERDITERIFKVIERREAIAIVGPRQSGKTTLLNILKDRVEGKGLGHTVYISFEYRRLAQQFAADPVEFVKAFTKADVRNFLFLDEVQLVPDAANALKTVFDLTSVKLIFTGSISVQLREIAAKMAGRVLSFRLMPFSFGEFLRARDPFLERVTSEHRQIVRDFVLNGTVSDLPPLPQDAIIEQLNRMVAEFMTFGGYPAVVLEADLEVKRHLLYSILSMVFERDILMLTSSGQFERFTAVLSALAGLGCGIFGFRNFCSELGINFRTLRKYVEAIENALIVSTLRPFHRNRITELKKSPKICFNDLGFRNIAVDSFSDPTVRPDKGVLGEIFVLSELLKLLPVWERISYWMTKSKQEVDFVIFHNDVPMPIEVKNRSMRNFEMPRGLVSFIKTYEPPIAMVVNKNLFGMNEFDGCKVLFVPFWAF